MKRFRLQTQRHIRLRREFFVTISIAAILLTASRPAIAQTINIDRVVAELEPEIQRALIAGNIPSASIALIAGDRVIWSGAYGYSNLWARTPATPSTVYLVGSTFKAMSTIALLQQMEQGKFKLDDRVNDYLTEFKIQNEDPQHPVTFRHLLTHTSGLPGGEAGLVPVWANTAPALLEEYLRKSLKVAKPPLTSVVYSNLAFTLVAYLVQKFAGVPYKQYVQEHIFTPLEMTGTAFEPTPDMGERLAVPYTVDGKTGSQVATVRLKGAIWPAGLVYGTVLNQGNWLITNLNGGVFKGKRIISEQILEQMFTRQYDQFKGGIEGIWGNDTAGFGLTWWVQVRDGERYIAHSGSMPGYTAFLLGNRDRKLGFAIMTNGNRAHAHLFKLADRAIDLLKKYTSTEKVAKATALGERRGSSAKPSSQPTIASAKEDAISVSGTYVLSRRSDASFLKATSLIGEFTVSPAEGDTIEVAQLTGPNGKPKRWREVASMTFLEENGQDKLVFKPDQNGRMQMITRSSPGEIAK